MNAPVRVTSARSIAEVARLIIRESSQAKRLAVVVAYLDESGTHGKSACTVVAGYVGLQDQWVEFEREWTALLERYAVTSVHGIDLGVFKKQFRDWNDARRADFYGDLSATIHRHALIGASAVLINKDYDAAFSGLPSKVSMDSKYGLCFRCCMVKIGSFVRENFPGAQASYVLEDGHRNKGDALRLFDLSKRSRISKARWPLGNIAFAGKNDYGALQAADLLAYSAYRYASAFVAAGNQHVEPHKNLVALWEGFPHIDALITREEMERTAFHLEVLVKMHSERGKCRPRN